MDGFKCIIYKSGLYYCISTTYYKKSKNERPVKMHKPVDIPYSGDDQLDEGASSCRAL